MSARVPSHSSWIFTAWVHQASCTGVNLLAERACSKNSRAGEGAGLADHDLQVVVQVQADGAFGDQPLVPGHFHVLVVNHQVRGVKDDPHALADQPDGDRVAVRADRNLAVAVDPRG